MIGNIGCNFYQAGYVFHGTRLSLKASSGTLVACGYLNDEEVQYLDALNRVAQYAIGQGRLQLQDASGTLLAEFAAVPTDPLVGTLWRVTTYPHLEGGLALPDRQLTAVFQPDGRLTGQANCNEYAGTYTATETRLVIGEAVTAGQSCVEPQGVMEQEAAYLAALRDVTGFDIRGRELYLIAADGNAVVSLYHESAAAPGAPIPGMAHRVFPEEQEAPASGEFDGPLGVAVDEQGNFYVADTFNHRIQKLSAAGEPLAQWGGQTP
jgi:heat shock protein HslJ